VERHDGDREPGGGVGAQRKYIIALAQDHEELRDEFAGLPRRWHSGIILCLGRKHWRPRGPAAMLPSSMSGRRAGLNGRLWDVAAAHSGIFERQVRAGLACDIEVGFYDAAAEIRVIWPGMATGL
jgi:hypothetical protein